MHNSSTEDTAIGPAGQIRSLAARSLTVRAKSALGVCGCLALLANPTSAADLAKGAFELPGSPISEASRVHDWSGFYAGIHAGYLTGQTNLDWYTIGNPVNVLGPFDFSSGFAGIHAGWNHQSGNLVLGVEGALDYTPFKGGEDGTPSTSKSFNASFEGRYMASVEGRAGIAVDDMLFYLSGGGAYLDARVSESNSGVSNDYGLWGYTLGGGAELALSDNDSVRLDYKYADFSPKFQEFNGRYEQALDPKFHMISLGFSHRF